MVAEGDDAANLPQRGNSTFWSAIVGFDWLKLPGAVRAIAHLVEGTGNAGAAWIDVAQAKGEQHSRAIRDTTASRSKTLAAYTDAAIRVGVDDPQLIGRTADYTAIKGIRGQQNREAIAVETASLLIEKPSDAATEPPEDDWLNVFADHAEKASTERMRKHWASILAGEVRKPGSFSFAALQIMSIMDANFADAITTARGWLAGGNIPMMPSKSQGRDFEIILRLTDCGMASLDGSRTRLFPNTFTIYQFDKQAIEVQALKEITIPRARLTRAGREILSIVDERDDPAFVAEFSEYLREKGAEVKPANLMPDARSAT